MFAVSSHANAATLSDSLVTDFSQSQPSVVATSVDLTTEVRWFFHGPLPADVQTWFTRADTVGLVEDRWDSYRVDDVNDTGVKRRFGTTLELKLRMEPPEYFASAEGQIGQLELWQRWSPADDRVDLHENELWMNVNKTVVKRRFDAAGDELPLSEATRAMGGQGCDAEIVALSVDNKPAWGFAFAAFGHHEDHHQLLQAAWGTLLGHEPVPPQLRLGIAGSYGYPEWLSRMANAKREAAIAG